MLIVLDAIIVSVIFPDMFLFSVSQDGLFWVNSDSKLSFIVTNIKHCHHMTADSKIEGRRFNQPEAKSFLLFSVLQCSKSVRYNVENCTIEVSFQ